MSLSFTENNKTYEGFSSYQVGSSLIAFIMDDGEISDIYSLEYPEAINTIKEMYKEILGSEPQIIVYKRR